MRERKALGMPAIEFLRLGVEQYLRELPDDEFAELMKVVRPLSNSELSEVRHHHV
jgi:hypothetical protein